jgi:hypothetical protein
MFWVSSCVETAKFGAIVVESSIVDGRVPELACLILGFRSNIEGFTGQTPIPLNRPVSPHQNFIDFSKFLENSKNFAEYEEYSDY